MNMPPNITFQKGLAVNNRVIPKCRAYYAAVEKELELGGLLSIQRSHVVGEYIIEILITRNSVFDFLYGNIKISSSLIKEEEEYEFLPYVNMLHGEAYDEEDTTISAFYSSRLAGIYSNNNPVPVYGTSVGNAFETQEPNTPLPPVDRVCISYTYSDTDTIVNFTGAQTTYSWYNNLPHPYPDWTIFNERAMAVYEEVKYYGNGLFVFDCRVKDKLLYLLTGDSSRNSYVELTVLSTENDGEDQRAVSTVFTITGTDDNMTYQNSEGSSNISAASTGGKTRLMHAKIDPECTTVSLLYSTEQYTDYDYYDNKDVTIPLSFVEGSLIAGPESSSTFMGEHLYHKTEIIEILTIPDLDNRYINVPVGEWHGRTDGIFTNGSILVDSGNSGYGILYYATFGEILLRVDSGVYGVFTHGSSNEWNGDTYTASIILDELGQDPSVDFQKELATITFTITSIYGPQVSTLDLSISHSGVLLLDRSNTKTVEESVGGAGYKVGYSYVEDRLDASFGLREWVTFKPVIQEPSYKRTQIETLVEVYYNKWYDPVNGISSPDLPDQQDPYYYILVGLLSETLPTHEITSSTEGVLTYYTGYFKPGILLNKVGTSYSSFPETDKVYINSSVFEETSTFYPNPQVTQVLSSGGSQEFSASVSDFTLHEGATYYGDLFGNYSIFLWRKSLSEATLPLIPNYPYLTLIEGLNQIIDEGHETAVVVRGVIKNVSSGFTQPLTNLVRAPYQTVYRHVDLIATGPFEDSSEAFYERLSPFDYEPGQGLRFEVSKDIFLVATYFENWTGDTSIIKSNKLWLEDFFGNILLEINTMVTPSGVVNINDESNEELRLICGVAHHKE